MASEPLESSTTVAKPVAAIDNEFPTYRAISSMAILSVVLGMASVFCYADLWFLLVVGGAVGAGVLALRRIKRYPEILTGAGYAKVGIGLGLLFGATALTQVVVQSISVSQDAKAFARHYTEILSKHTDESVDLALWYQQPPKYRLTKSPKEIADELHKIKSPGTPDTYVEKTVVLNQIKNRLKGPNESIEFSMIESTAVDGLTLYANALLELDGPGSKDFPDKEQFVLVQMTKTPEGGPDDWVITDLRYPYIPKSTVATVHKESDGHGHSH